jgi:malate dehydrogenase (oxaloacetate-decarboxylating)(NADP+)
MKPRPEAALDYHEQGRPGKIAVVPTKPVATQRDLALAYSPGVAEPCRRIAEDPEAAFRYTARANLVAVVSNGTAVLGLGNLGALASKPVMEGKAVLFKRFADIDVFDLEVDAPDPDDVIRFCTLLQPTVGGINLEDIGAPECFRIERALRATLDVPVFHDDQHGTAIITGAALLNALDLAGKAIGDVRVVFAGAGAAATATAEHYLRLGVDPERVLLVDESGVLEAGRADQLDEFRRPFARATECRTLADALRGADVFVGLSVGGIVTAEMVASMASSPIIFALANPDPEITPEEVASVRDDAIIATGRTDYPNQVNNVLGFPFIFRGALDVRARAINEEMKLAATHALASLAKEDVPEAVAAAYGEEAFQFGRDYLIPKPFDHRVLLWVAPAVAEAAMRTGVARLQLNPEEYRNRLEARLGRRREVMRDIVLRARRDPRTIVFPEGESERVIRAAAQIVDEGIARPVLIGRDERVADAAYRLGADLDGVQVIDLRDEEERRERYAEAFWRQRQRKGVTRAEASERMMNHVYFGCMMVKEGEAEGLVAGVEANYPDTARPALETIGTDADVERVAGLYMMVLEQDLMFFADTTVTIDPDAEALADIALLSARFVQRLGVEPRLAMLSFSNFGSARHPASERVARATALVRERAPDLMVDGEMQADTAVEPDILATYPFSALRRPANVLIFPDLDSANISYKLLWRLGGVAAIGPILLGMARPVHVLQRGSQAAEIVNLAAIAVVDAQQRSGPAAPAD